MSGPLEAGGPGAPVAAVIPVTDTVRFAVLRQLLRKPQGAFCIAWLGMILVLAVFAPWIAPYPPGQTDLAAANLPPLSPGHILGGDRAGLDILSRLVWGARQSLIAVSVVTIVSLSLGVTTGLVAGYYRGKWESVTNFVSDVIMSMPGIVMLIALYALTGPNLIAAMAIFGVILAPNYYRLVRSIVIGVRNELYVDAARVVGLSDLRIVGRHILWAVRAPVIIQTAFVMAAGIGIEAGVSFIGLGDKSQPSWGQTLQVAFRDIYFNPWSVLWPAILISTTILCLILLGNSLSDVLQSSVRPKVLSPRRRRKVMAEEQARVAALPPFDSPVVGSSDDVLLSIRGLRIAYPMADGTVKEVVHGVDFDLRRGEIHGLVGESGSGKTQIAFSVLGILPREALVLGGSVLLDGEDLMADSAKMRAARGRRIGYIPQEPMANLDPSFTVGAQLVQGLRATRDLSKEDARARLVELLVRVGIKDPERVMKLYPHEISGGMAQRVLICGAIASDPDILVADEPTTALDVTVQAEVLEKLRELSVERGLAMILVTHNLGVVADLCHTVTVMRDGNFVEHADIEEIFDSPQSPYTQQLLASSRSVELMEI